MALSPVVKFAVALTVASYCGQQVVVVVTLAAADGSGGARGAMEEVEGSIGVWWRLGGNGW